VTSFSDSTRELVEERRPFAEQHGHEPDPDLVEQLRLEALACDPAAVDADGLVAG